MKVVDQGELAARIQFLKQKKNKRDDSICVHFVTEPAVAWAHLGDGADGVPALRQDLGVGVVEEADEPRQQAACVGAVVKARARKVGVQDGDGGLPESGVGAPCSLQEVLDDDPLAHLVFH